MKKSKINQRCKTVSYSVKQFRAARKPLCSKCGAETRKPNQRWGAKCMAAYMRGWRRSQMRKRAYHEGFAYAVQLLQGAPGRE